MQLHHEDGTPKTAAELANVSGQKPPKREAKRVAPKPKPPQQPEPEPKPAKVAKPKAEPRPTCSHAKKNGTPCTAKVMMVDGKLSDHCTDHRPPHMHLTVDEMTAVAGWVRTTTGAKDEERVVRTAEALVRLMGWGQVREAVRRGEFKA